MEIAGALLATHAAASLGEIKLAAAGRLLRFAEQQQQPHVTDAAQTLVQSATEDLEAAIAAVDFSRAFDLYV